MIRGEELEAVVLVLSFFCLSLVLLVCVLKWDIFVEFMNKIKCCCRRRCCCCRHRDEESQEYRTLNELLFDANSPEEAVGRLANSEEGAWDVSFDSLFPDLLGEKESDKKRAERSAQEPLL